MSKREIENTEVFRKSGFDSDSVIDLMEHHADIAEALARMEGSVKKVAEWRVNIIRTKSPQYQLDNPHYAKQSRNVYEVVVYAARNGQIRRIPDGKRDILCVNCHQEDCRIVQGLTALRKITRRSQWEIEGIKPLDD